MLYAQGTTGRLAMLPSPCEYAFARTHLPSNSSRRHALCFVQVQDFVFRFFLIVRRQGCLPCPIGIGIGGFVRATVGGGGE
jgi:hypothetical protein